MFNVVKVLKFFILMDNKIIILFVKSLLALILFDMASIRCIGNCDGRQTAFSYE